MQEVHSRSQVIWYDAVTIQGELKWQNTLNADNRPFFDASDAIFINYAWKVLIS
jgi:mannosyl-glycoprotein endo-beta-N-acetylglucosaminidase